MVKLTEELRQKILWEYRHGYEANRSKNSLFMSQKDIYSTKRNDELLRSQIFWSVSRTMQATCIINEPDVSWEDENVLYQMEARNFTDMYKTDYANENWGFDRYMWLEDVCKYWKAVFLFSGYDDKKNVPTIQRIDPRFVYPYNDGSLLVKDYPFFGFDRVITYKQLEELPVSANKEFKEQIMWNYDTYLNGLETEDAFLRNICTCYNATTGHYTIHYHYTYIYDEDTKENKLYLVLMLCDQIMDIYDVPETDNIIPIAVYGFAYDAQDWWGTSLVNIIEDGHRTEQLLLNLYKIKVTREAMGGNIFIDEQVFMNNVNTLKNQSIKNRWFPVKMRDMTKPISSMVYELPQTQISSDLYNSLWMIKNKALAESFTNATAQWLGLSSNSDPNTATASKIQKINANMITSLQNQILSYWTKDFAELYRDFMLYHWRNSKKKVIRRVNNGLSWTYKKVTKKDIRGDFSIMIVDPILKDIIYQEKKAAYMEQYNMLVSDPKTPPFLLNNIRRAIAYYNWLDESEIDSITEMSPEDYQCKMDVLLLNQNVSIYIPQNANIQMRLWYYNRAEDTDAKFRAIQALQYMVQQWLGTVEENMAAQPKVTDFKEAWENNDPLTNINYDTVNNLDSWTGMSEGSRANWSSKWDSLNVSWMQSINTSNGMG